MIRESHSKGNLDLWAVIQHKMVGVSKLAPVDNPDTDFARERALARRRDLLAMSTGKVTPEEVQRKNSIFPQDFWSKAKINWNSFAIGTKSQS